MNLNLDDRAIQHKLESLVEDYSDSNGNEIDKEVKQMLLGDS